MIKTISLKTPVNLIKEYRLQKKLAKDQQERSDKEFEDYMCREILKTEERKKAGAKTYTREEFVEEMRLRYGIILSDNLRN